MRREDCLPLFVASHKTSSWKVGSLAAGRGGLGREVGCWTVGGRAAPTSAAQRDEGRRLKAGMTGLEMAPIRAALTLDPLSPLAAHRIFMLLGLSLPFQARGQLFTKDSDYASSINVSWKLNFIPSGRRTGFSFSLLFFPI